MVENGELVGGFNLPLWKMMEFVSDDEIPNFSWNIKSMFQSPPTRWGFLLRHIWWPRKASFFWPHQLELIPPTDDHIHGETSYLLVGETVEKLGKTKKQSHFLQGFPHFSSSSSSSSSTLSTLSSHTHFGASCLFFYQPSTSHLLSLVGLDHPYEPSTISRPGRAVRDMERYGEIWRYKASVGPQKKSITKLTKLSGTYYMALIWQLWQLW